MLFLQRVENRAKKEGFPKGMFLKAIEHKNHHLANNCKLLVLEYLKTHRLASSSANAIRDEIFSPSARFILIVLLTP
jgi:hypothetical protein